MHCEFCEKIRDLATQKVTKSLREQHAILNEHQIESLIDFEIDKMAEKLIDLLDNAENLVTRDQIGKHLFPKNGE